MTSNKKRDPSYGVDGVELALVLIESIDARLKLLQGSIAKAGTECEKLTVVLR